MLANISVGCDANISILEAIQMFSAALKMSGAATIVTCFHTARILPQDENKSELQRDHMVKNW
jgi:cell division protein FtsL